MKNNIKVLRDLSIFLTSSVILTFYGDQVCPFLESMSFVELFLIISIPFILGWGGRSFIIKKMLRNEIQIKLPIQIFKIDLVTWLLVGSFVTIYNFIIHDFPITSGLKVVLGGLTLGLFSSAYISLEYENEVLKDIIKNKNKIDLLDDKFVSISKKFSVFTIFTLCFVAGVLLLLVYKDFVYVIDRLNRNEPFKFRWVIQEILFVFGLLLFGSIVLSKQYGRNLKLIFSMQLNTLKEIGRGNLDGHVPSITNDELGIIAKHTNMMILDLKEKNELKQYLANILIKVLQTN